jgi:hypothetical protein
MSVLSKDNKTKMQDNQYKETSTDEVGTEYKRIQRNRVFYFNFACVVFLKALA